MPVVARRLHPRSTRPKKARLDDRGGRDCSGLWTFRLLDTPQGTLQVPCAQSLDAGIVLSIERRHTVRASGCSSGIWRTKPQSDVVGMNWSRRRVGIRIRNRLVVHNRSGTASWRDNEGFNA